jgi:hypothetical protein
LFTSSDSSPIWIPEAYALPAIRSFSIWWLIWIRRSNLYFCRIRPYSFFLHIRWSPENVSSVVRNSKERNSLKKYSEWPKVSMEMAMLNLEVSDIVLQ